MMGEFILLDECVFWYTYFGFRSLMFNTGDLGRWLENGTLENHGRVDDQVKIKVNTSLMRVGGDMLTFAGISS